jgi:protoporphyrinogen oxidase
MIIYDCIIIGAGPAGLTFATLADKNEKIMIIEKDAVIGGCHKVNRQKYENEYYFCEHGPRVYINNYVNFKMILNKLGVKFKDLFIRNKKTTLETLYDDVIKTNIYNNNENLSLMKEFLNLLFDPNYAKNLSMKEYLINNNFSKKAIDYTDRTCRIIDGGDINKISLNTFLHVMNETLLYNTYQPRMPNDEGLFYIWRRYLKQIEIKLNTIITKIDETDSIITLTSNNENKYYTKKLILAIPPENLNKILINSSSNINTINDLELYANNTKYNEYISITFHWNFKFDIETVSFVNNSDWGITSIILSDYMRFKENNSKTVISCNITLTDNKSSIINKTANECKDKNEIIYETYRQLKQIYKSLPIPTLAFINNYYYNGIWKSNETAFLKTPNNNYLRNNKLTDNIYLLGTHTGNSKVHFTSMESAITNAIELVNKIYKTEYKIKRPYTIKDVIIIFIFILIIIIILFIIKY